jgi:hypothetical protein
MCCEAGAPIVAPWRMLTPITAEEAMLKRLVAVARNNYEVEEAIILCIMHAVH